MNRAGGLCILDSCFMMFQPPRSGLHQNSSPAALTSAAKSAHLHESAAFSKSSFAHAGMSNKAAAQPAQESQPPVGSFLDYLKDEQEDDKRSKIKTEGPGKPQPSVKASGNEGAISKSQQANKKYDGVYGEMTDILDQNSQASQLVEKRRRDEEVKRQKILKKQRDQTINLRNIHREPYHLPPDRNSALLEEIKRRNNVHTGHRDEHQVENVGGLSSTAMHAAQRQSHHRGSLAPDSRPSVNEEKQESIQPHRRHHDLLDQRKQVKFEENRKNQLK